MSLDSRYIIASDLQSVFRDKDTGRPLRNGVIYFWADQARTIPKSVFKITGTPPNYSYVDLGAVINLTSIGTVSDNGPNDIILYYFPYDSDNNVELYFVQVYSEGGNITGVFQFSREGWPNFSATDTSASTLNYVPNGQFLLHTNIPATDSTVFGQVTAGITYLGQGGWTFERPNSSTAKDVITFNPLPAANGLPRFNVEINTQSPNAGDTFKDLRLKFNDVNKFVNTTQRYAFQARSNTGSNLTVNIILIKNFGTGGSTTTETVIGTLTITPTYSFAQIKIPFGDNSGKTIGPNNDDYLQIAIRLPTDIVLDVLVTDAIVTPDTGATINNFPTTTDAQFKYQSLAGWMPVPAPDGSDLYLAVKPTRQGMIFDHGEIGDVVYESSFQNYTNGISTITNRLLPIGTQYETSAYSALGIPFKRLQQYFWNPTVNCPAYGTGPNYFTVFSPFNSSSMTVSNNSLGTVTAPADGTPATGFTFATNTPIANTFATCVMYTSNNFLVIDAVQGVTNPPTAGTSGFSVSVYRAGSSINKEIDAFSAVAATSLASTYFTFEVFSGHNFYVWFKVSGSGTDPAPGGTGILVNLLTGDTADIVAQKCFAAINCWQYSTITTVAGSAIPPDSYFTINSTTTSYYVWYTVDSMGTDPKPVGKLPIPVAVLSTDTNIQVATKTQIAMNSKYFAVPNWPGMFLRNIDTTNTIDLDVRYSYVPGIIGNIIGTYQLDDLRSHLHTAGTIIGGASNILQGNGGGVGDIVAGSDYGYASITASTAINPFGGTETVPVNAGVNFAIKY